MVILTDYDDAWEDLLPAVPGQARSLSASVEVKTKTMTNSKLRGTGSSRSRQHGIRKMAAVSGGWR